MMNFLTDTRGTLRKMSNFYESPLVLIYLPPLFINVRRRLETIQAFINVQANFENIPLFHELAEVFPNPLALFEKCDYFRNVGDF
jgi:hypothetical protein